jgi:hypothetical protein
MAAQRQPTLRDALNTWDESDLRGEVHSLIHNLEKPELVSLLEEFDWFHDSANDVIREAFPEPRDGLTAKGVCQCGHLRFAHADHPLMGEQHPCEVRDCNYRRCACFDYSEDMAAEWVGNNASRAGWL